MIKEEGEVEEKVVMNELFAEVSGQVRQLSSVDGLRQTVSFPFSLVKNIALKIKVNGQTKVNREKRGQS